MHRVNIDYRLVQITKDGYASCEHRSQISAYVLTDASRYSHTYK
jgi:hypothetical protein